LPSIILSATGDQLLHGDGADVVARDVDSSKEVYRLRGHTVAVNDLRFSPDGSRIATVSDDGTIKFWISTTEDEVFSIQNNNGGFVWLEFSRDGNRLLAGGFDRTALIWETTQVSPENRWGTKLD
jgi:WD40 repeat protein